MRDTIFIDFDGVIRLWSNVAIKASENAAGVEEGTLLSVAFSPNFLYPAITGVISHEQWVSNVGSELTEKYDNRISQHLLSGWESASWEINSVLLEQIRIIAPQYKLVLVTNATTKLSDDLEVSGVACQLDFIVNSAEIGVAKPSLQFYHKALSIADSTPAKSLFIDDSLSHVEAANSVGMLSILHNSNAETIRFVRQNCT